MRTYDSIMVKDESSEYQVTSVVAVTPTWRDVWAILRKRYKPKVKWMSTITMAGADKLLKEHFTEQVNEALHQKQVIFPEHND